MNAVKRQSTVTLFVTLLLVAGSAAQQATPPEDSATVAAPPASSYSKVRIVRLSEVVGVAQLDRNTGAGFEKAIANIPIVEQARLQTGTGAAEVEFEDSSSLRIAPGSLIAFSRLELLPSGAKASTVDVLQGMVYVSMASTKGNEFALRFGQQTIHLDPSSHIRLQIDKGEAKLAVLDGVVQVASTSGITEVGKKKTVTLSLANQSEPAIAKNVAANDFDSWDHQAVDYHKRAATLTAFGGIPNSYGFSDMAYYGSFTNAAGCGSMWRPYFVSAAWEPFANGTWAWYPNAGYSWVSPYPWGWTPFHSGSWAYCPSTGWGWQPGNTWSGINNGLVLKTVKGQPVHSPLPPVHPPVFGRPTMVPVNTRPLAISALGGPETFVFRKDSAGLGVPRGTLGRLDKLSVHAEQHGAASRPVYAPIYTPGASTPGAGNRGGAFGGNVRASGSQGGGYSNHSSSAGASSTARSSGGGGLSASGPVSVGSAGGGLGGGGSVGGGASKSH